MMRSAMRRRPDYDYGPRRRRRSWRYDDARDRWLSALMLVVGLSIAGYIVYLCVTK